MNRVATASYFYCTDAESKLFGGAWCSFPFVVISFLFSFDGSLFPVNISIVLNPGSELALIFIDQCNLNKMIYNSSFWTIIRELNNKRFSGTINETQK